MASRIEMLEEQDEECMGKYKGQWLTETLFFSLSGEGQLVKLTILGPIFQLEKASRSDPIFVHRSMSNSSASSPQILGSLWVKTVARIMDVLPGMYSGFPPVVEGSNDGRSERRMLHIEIQSRRHLRSLERYRGEETQCLVDESPACGSMVYFFLAPPCLDHTHTISSLV